LTERSLGSAVEALADLIAELRAKCPWDQEQTHASLTKYLVEESQEVVEALAALENTSGDERTAAYAELEEELGDLWLQILLHSQLASEEGAFDLTGVAERLHAKLVRRHPHVFGDFEATTAEEVNANWQRIKAAEQADKAAGSG
jgi:tetrapyrrole methylase family protein / MazG family protein